MLFLPIILIALLFLCFLSLKRRADGKTGVDAWMDKFFFRFWLFCLAVLFALLLLSAIKTVHFGH